jgi:hypothetical protein
VGSIKFGGVEKESRFEGMSVMAYCLEDMRSKFFQTKYVKSTFERGPQGVETSIPKTKIFMESVLCDFVNEKIIL